MAVISSDATLLLYPLLGVVLACTIAIAIFDRLAPLKHIGVVLIFSGLGIQWLMMLALFGAQPYSQPYSYSPLVSFRSALFVQHPAAYGICFGLVVLGLVYAFLGSKSLKVSQVRAAIASALLLLGGALIALGPAPNAQAVSSPQAGHAAKLTVPGQRAK